MMIFNFENDRSAEALETGSVTAMRSAVYRVDRRVARRPRSADPVFSVNIGLQYLRRGHYRLKHALLDEEHVGAVLLHGHEHLPDARTHSARIPSY